MSIRESQLKKTLINIKSEETKNNPFGEEWTSITSKIKKTSPFRNFVTYSVNTIIKIKRLNHLLQKLMMI